MDKLYEYKSMIERRKGQKDQTEKRIETLETEHADNSNEVKFAEQAQIIIQLVAKETQEELEYHISDLVSLSLASVFGNPYNLDVNFEVKRGKTECQLSFVRDGMSIHPMNASGGGAVDVASFGLRVALWSLARPRTAPILLIDEPFKHLSRELHSKASEMIMTISKKLGIQVLMVSHSEDLIESADKVFRNRIRKGVSYIN